jgi:hypothetical protein
MQTTPGFLAADGVYTLEETRSRLQVGKAAWRSLRDAGFPTVKLPGVQRRYVLGHQVITWMAGQQPHLN